MCGVTGGRAQSPLLPPHHHSSTASFLANSQILLFLRYRCSALPFAQTQWRPSAILLRLCVIINSSAFIYCAQLHFPTGFHSLWSMMSCSIDFNRSHFLKIPLYWFEPTFSWFLLKTRKYHTTSKKGCYNRLPQSYSNSSKLVWKDVY